MHPFVLSTGFILKGFKDVCHFASQSFTFPNHRSTAHHIVPITCSIEPRQRPNRNPLPFNNMPLHTRQYLTQPNFSCLYYKVINHLLPSHPNLLVGTFKHNKKLLRVNTRKLFQINHFLRQTIIFNSNNASHNRQPLGCCMAFQGGSVFVFQIAKHTGTTPHLHCPPDQRFRSSNPITSQHLLIYGWVMKQTSFTTLIYSCMRSTKTHNLRLRYLSNGITDRSVRRVSSQVYQVTKYVENSICRRRWISYHPTLRNPCSEGSNTRLNGTPLLNSRPCKRQSCRRHYNSFHHRLRPDRWKCLDSAQVGKFFSKYAGRQNSEQYIDLDSRTGTIGLFQSLQVLGYRPFHITELLPHGNKEMHALGDAMIASESDEPWPRENFDKLFGNYDVS